MKKLEPIKIGEHTVEISVEENQAYPATLSFSVRCCGETKAEGSWSHRGAHDHSDEQFAKDFQERIDLLAKEAAGRCRSANLINQLVAK